MTDAVNRGNFLCGIDEAGRGCLAGPVCAAAVVLPPDFPAEGLNDSKKLSEKKRYSLMRTVYAGAVSWGVGWASAAEIDAHNILRASLCAMQRAYNSCMRRLAERQGIPVEAAQAQTGVVADGLFCPDVVCASLEAVVKADSKIPAVMAASILAKTARDKMMIRYSWLYPEYGYERHKGYGTARHLAVLENSGPSPIQRTTFRIRKSGFRIPLPHDDPH